MVAAKGPTPHTTMYKVCRTMEDIWDLQVLCPCRDKNPDLVCEGAYMTSTVRCMGVSIYVSAGGCVAHAHPNALHDVWRLKHGAPLQSFWATSTRRTTDVFLSALSNTLPFLRSWGSSLISVAAWMQLAVLSGYPTLAVRASATTAVHRVLAKTSWDVPLSTGWEAFISVRLPQSFPDTIADLLTWLQRSAVWQGACYALWHISHLGTCSDICADWSRDILVLHDLLSVLSSTPRVDWGVHRGRGGPC